MYKLPRRWIVVGTMITLLATSGCVFTGRQYPTIPWGMNYAANSPIREIPSHSSSQVRLVQDFSDIKDAIIQPASSGIYLGGNSTTSGWPAASGSIGVSHMPSPWSTMRYGVFGMDNGGIGVGGVEGGIRFHAPTRFTPYVGLSGDFGFSSLHSGIARYSTRYSQKGRLVSQATGLLAVVPEAGVSYWLNPSTRLNAGASYFVPDGRPDFFAFGLSMEFFLPGSSDFGGASFGESPGSDPTYHETSAPYFVEAVNEPAPQSLVHASVDGIVNSSVSTGPGLRVRTATRTN